MKWTSALSKTAKPSLGLLLGGIAAVILFVALAMPSSGVQAQGVRPSTSVTLATGIPTVVNDLPPLDGKISPPEFSNLDSVLNNLLTQGTDCDNVSRPSWLVPDPETDWQICLRCDLSARVRDGHTIPEA